MIASPTARPDGPRFAGQVALCVGAATGMGRVTAEALVREGARVVMADVNPSVHEAFAEIVGEAGPDRGFSVVLDVRSADDCDAMVARAVEELGGVDILAFFSGVLQQAGEVADLADEEWDRVLDINLGGCFHVLRAGARVMREQRRGRIVAIASDWGRVGIGLFSAYCVSKAGVIVLAQALADELGPCGVTVNTVSPGLINTAMHEQALRDEAAQRGLSFEEMRDLEWGKVPMKAAGEPEDIANAVLFLASDEARYITGASIDVTGGLMRR